MLMEWWGWIALVMAIMSGILGIQLIIITKWRKKEPEPLHFLLAWMFLAWMLWWSAWQ